MSLISELKEPDRELETYREEFVAACEQAVRTWARQQVTALIITKHEVTLGLSSAELSSLKGEITAILDSEISSHIQAGLEKKEYWWHLQPEDQTYQRVEIKNPFSPTLKFHSALFESAKLVLGPLRRYGYLTETETPSVVPFNDMNFMLEHLKFSLNVKAAVPFAWSKNMITILLEYNQRVRAGKEILKELHGSEDQGLRQAWEAWEKA